MDSRVRRSEDTEDADARHRADRSRSGPPSRPGHVRRPGGAARPVRDGPAARGPARTARWSRRGRRPRSRCLPPGRCPAGWSRPRSPCPALGLLTALAVERSGTVDPGAGARWQAELPADAEWTEIGEVPTSELAGQVERELAAQPAGGPSPAELDRIALTVPDPHGPPVRVPLRCLFALSGLGLLDDPDTGPAVRVAASRSWLRLDAAVRVGGPAPARRAPVARPSCGRRVAGLRPARRRCSGAAGCPAAARWPAAGRRVAAAPARPSRSARRPAWCRLGGTPGSPPARRTTPGCARC